MKEILKPILSSFIDLGINTLLNLELLQFHHLIIVCCFLIC